MSGATIRGTVGPGAANAPADVRIVQRLLAPRAAELGLPPLAATGACDDATIRAIRAYQIRICGDDRGTGRLQPGDRFMEMLADDSPAARQREGVRARRAREQMSGADWLERNGGRFLDSRDVGDLRPAFAANVAALLRALERAGAFVRIEATLRSARRAWLIASAGTIARSGASARDVPSDPEIGIIWNHGEDGLSQDAAEAMVAVFGEAKAAPAGSPQLLGLAVEMDVRWFGTIGVRDAHGGQVRLDRPQNAVDHAALHRLARSYGVVKAPGDPLLWLAATA